jgi:hypothetical protein
MAALAQLARFARVVDGPVVFNPAHGVHVNRDGVAPTLTSSDELVVFIPPEV